MLLLAAFSAQGFELLRFRSATSPTVSGTLKAASAPVLLLASTHFLMMADRHLPTLVMGDLKRVFDLSDFRLGLLQGPAFVVFYVAATMLSASLIDRWPRARFIAAAIAIWTLATIGFGLATSWQQLVMCRLLLGLAQAAVAPAGLSWITGANPRVSLGRAVSKFSTGSALGRSGALLIGGLILGAAAATVSGHGLTPWRVLFLLSALPNLVVATAFALRPAAPLPAMSPEATLIGRWRSVLAERPGLILAQIAGACCVVLVIQATAAWMPSALNRMAGFSPAESALVAGAIVLVGAPIGHLGGGMLVDRARGRGHSPVWICALALLGGVASAAFLSVPNSIPALEFGFLLVTVFGGAAGAAALGCFQMILSEGTYGTGNAIYLALVNLVGLGIGPPLVGLLSDRVFGPTHLGLAIFGVVVVVGLIGASAFAVALRLWPRREPPIRGSVAVK